MKNNYILLFAAVVCVTMTVFLSGCGVQPAVYIPSVSFQSPTTDIRVTTNQTSEIVTITITKTDNEGKPTAFDVMLDSSNEDYFYPISVTGSGARLTEAQTKILIDEGSSDTVQFKVYGTLPSGLTSATGTITARLYYNNSLMSNVAPLSFNIHVSE
jgi:hypothetical protein